MTKENKFQVALIIINYNSSNFTLDCIKSIITHTESNLKYQIIIIDNNSKIEDFSNLTIQIPKLENMFIFRSKQNIGFSAANMLGTQFADAEYLFFLNNDTEFMNDCQSILYDFMSNNQRVGLCTAQMHNSDKSHHNSFGYFPNLKLLLLGESILRLFNPNDFPPKDSIYKENTRVPLVTGAAMFVRVKIFSEIGGFDTNYFLYCEEEDFAKKLHNINAEIFLVPEAKFIHHIGKSTERNILIERENYISLMYYFRKHCKSIEYTALKLLYFLKVIRKGFKRKGFFSLAFFILWGANMKYSLKHQQKINFH